MKPEAFDALSDEEILAMATALGLELPTGLERSFVIEEIIEAREEDESPQRGDRDSALRIEERKYAAAPLGCGDRGACAELEERRYNETSLHVIVRDQAWAFAFWDLSDSDRALLAREDGSSPLFLRVFELGEEEGSGPEHHDIAVGLADGSWYVNLPQPETRYRVELCARLGIKIRVLARSEDLRAPRAQLRRDDSGSGAGRDRLFALAGADRLALREPVEAGSPARILGADDE